MTSGHMLRTRVYGVMHALLGIGLYAGCAEAVSHTSRQCSFLTSCCAQCLHFCALCVAARPVVMLLRSLPSQVPANRGRQTACTLAPVDVVWLAAGHDSAEL
ncbi:hypothetical protein COO60DRAFT_454250 [Scenedesmus sp. NREL 46B-D3]|nr:hypothetical protein COO60DRAFT_454250 [Scenedesmus sp. NREL 46B-D3]